MANELRANYNGSATIYAIIRRKSDAYVWNGTAFAVWADGSIANYDVALSSQGGDLYSADMPAAIAAGTYLIDVYVRAGATPATTDLRLSGYELYWGTTAASSPSGDDLTTLALVKQHMGISVSTHDAKLQAILTAASRAVVRWCDREFASASLVEYYDGRDAWRRGFLPLKRFPVSSITRVAAYPDTVITVKNTATTTNQLATVAVSSTAVTLVRVASGVSTTNTLTIANYATLTDLKTAIDALGNGWSATVAGDSDDYGKWPTSYLRAEQGALNARSETGGAELQAHIGDLSDYRLDSGDSHATIYGAFRPGFLSVEVRYTAGYTTIPDPVQQGVCAVVKALWDFSKLDGNVQSERIGDYAYTMGSTPNLNAPLFADARFYLDYYRRPRAL